MESRLEPERRWSGGFSSDRSTCVKRWKTFGSVEAGMLRPSKLVSGGYLETLLQIPELLQARAMLMARTVRSLSP